MDSNCIEEIIAKKFNEHYKDKFKNIRNVLNNLNDANGWEVRFKILKKLLKTLPKTEFTLLRGRYKGKFLVYCIISNRFTIRETEFFLKDCYCFVNGKYILVDFKDSIIDGENIFEDENIYLLLELEKLKEEVTCNQKFTRISSKIKQEKIVTPIKESNLNLAENEDLIFEDEFIINDEDEAIILDENLTDEEIKEFLKDFK